MELILLESIPKLGKLGDKVSVKAGYARNYLYPRNKAIPANKHNLEAFEKRRGELEKNAAAQLKAAEQRAAALDGKRISIVANASDEGKLFGSIGTREVANALIAMGNEIQKSEVLLSTGAFRQVGEYEVTLRLHSEVEIKVPLVIIAEENK